MGQMEDHFTNHTVTVGGDYEMCFINRYSLIESKKIMWEVDVTGEEEDMETNDSPELRVNQTLEEYTQQARELRIAIVKVEPVSSLVSVTPLVSQVRTRLSKARSQQWWLSSKTPKDTERLMAINQMIDTWSTAYSVLIIVVSILQAVFVRRLFNIKPTTYSMKMRT